MLPIEQLNALSESCRDTARQLAESALEGAGSMASLNLDAFEEAINTGAEQVREAWSEMAGFDSLAAWPGLFSRQLQRSSDLSLALIGIASRLQNDFASVVELQVRNLRDSSLSALEAAAPENKLSVARQNAAEFVERKTRKAA